MKAGLLASATVLSLLATAASALAADPLEPCSNANLKGRYGLATHGVVIGVYDKATPPTIHYYETPVNVDLVSDETSDGRGNSTFSYLGFFNGTKFSTPREPSEVQSGGRRRNL
jgi:opacity protein-like surface antigen